MKLFSKGGKYTAAPQLVEKKRRNPAGASAENVRPASKPAPKPAPSPVPQPVPKPVTPPVSKPVESKVVAASSLDATRVVPAVKPAPVAKAPVEAAPKISHDKKVAERKAKSKTRKNRSIAITAIAIFCVIMVGTLLFLFIRKAKAANDFRQLADQIQQIEEHEATAPPTTEYIEQTIPTVSVSDPTEPVETEPPVKTILPKYAGFYQDNTEFFGWLRMEDTVLDYPVMRSHEDNDEYLYANFEGEYSYAGIPFADVKCSHDSDNIVIYGHNIRDGSMFRPLFKYEDEDYWKEHPTIMFSDLYEDYEYEVLSVFRDRVYYKYEDVFKFYQFIDAENEEDFDYAIEQLKEKSIYDTGVDAEYGDKLITLVTCAYHTENGRFVVVARRK